jgi:hypothetical protein
MLVDKPELDRLRPLLRNGMVSYCLPASVCRMILCIFRGEVMRTIGILALVVSCAACAGNETTQLRSKEQRESPARGGQATPGSAKRQAALTDQEISEIIVRTSRQGYYSTGRSCACPDDSARGGSRCGMRSAYSRPGGASPKCYLLDVTTADIAAFRARQLSHRIRASGSP